jgi:phage gpG-like protein
MNLQRITLQIAEKLREIATRQGNVPFDKGDLRKSHVVEPSGDTDAILSANTPYARAVHDGRPAITIKPKRKKALAWKGARHPAKSVKQPARKGNPWLARAVQELEQEGLGFLEPEFGEEVADEFTRALRAGGLEVRRRN